MTLHARSAPLVLRRPPRSPLPHAPPGAALPPSAHRPARLARPLYLTLPLRVATSRKGAQGRLGAYRSRRSPGVRLLTPPAFQALWLVHSLIFTALFGYLHQGGLVPATLALNEHLRDSTSRLGAARVVNVVFWRTFMPPRHLLLPLAPGTHPFRLSCASDPHDLTLPHAQRASPSPLSASPTSPAHLCQPSAPRSPPSITKLLPSCLLRRRTPSKRTASPACPPLPLPQPRRRWTRPRRLPPPSAVKRRCLEQLVPGRRSYGIHVDMDRLGDLAGARWDTAGVGLWMVE